MPAVSTRRRATAVLFVLLVFSPALGAGGRPLHLVLAKDPVLKILLPSAQCIANVSWHYKLNLGVYLAILRTEAGKPGSASRNDNGTYDLGPGQVNTTWIKRFRKFGIPATTQLLKNNTCFNLYAAGWILRYELDRAPDYWTGVGRYHSRTRWRQQRYSARVYKNWRRLYRNAAR